MMKAKKIILVGAGAVGCSFLYSAMNRGLASEYGIIDVNKANVEGQTLDFEDGSAPSDYPFNVFPAEYSDCKDADLVVITAGRPQLPGETRLNMVEGNAKIMKEIATNIKQSGFKGITVIASNPVDILTLIYQEVTGFDKKTVIGSGTSLDSARLTREISKRINIAPQSIQAYVLGEHGDSSVSAFSVATVGGLPLSYFVKNKRIDESRYDFCVNNGWQEYIDRMLVVDYLILNRDRHGANVEVLRDARRKTLRIAPLFDHGLSFLCSCQSSDEIMQFDILEDKPCQNFIGSRSTLENLGLITNKKNVFQAGLKLQDKERLCADLSSVLSELHLNRIWDMLWARWYEYEKLCNLWCEFE